MSNNQASLRRTLPQDKYKVRVLVAELKASRSIQRGRKLHAEAAESGIDSCIYVATALVKMYTKCGSMVDAQQVFNSIKHPDVVLWTALILGYAENGEGATALDLFGRMSSQGCAPDSFTFVSALKACTVLAQQDGNGRAECLKWGKRIHAEIRGHFGCGLDMYIRSTLIDMYAKCGCMSDACQVFESTKRPNVVSWTALILGYADNGEGETALNLFAKMKSQGCVPDSVTFIAALKACISLALQDAKADCLKWGRQVHSEITCSDIYVQCTLIDMYAKCGSMTDVQQVFDSIKQPNVVSWNALIMGYAENGEGVIALDQFQRMKAIGCAPDWITFVAVLKACCLLGALESGRKVHEAISMVVSNLILITCLVDFYAKCGSMLEAQKVFDMHPGARDLTTWTALSAGYCRLGDHQTVFELFEEMRDVGMRPDGVTFVCILACCTHCGLVVKAKDVFEAMPTKYGVSPTVDHYNCMVDILGRSNELDNAMALLRTMACRPGTVTWMTVLGACHKWKNVGLGKLAFRSVMSWDEGNAAAYLLVEHIYWSKGMHEEQKMVSVMRRTQACNQLGQQPGQSYWTNELGEVSAFC